MPQLDSTPPTLNFFCGSQAWEMEMPSFASSPCTRGAPQKGLALLMFRISSRISRATLGRPGLRRRLFQVQYRLNPERCQRTTVSGFTMTRTLSQSVQILCNSTQNSRSTFESRGRFTERWRTASCCRRATFSRASSRRALKAEMRARTNDKIMQAWCRQTGDYSSSVPAHE